MPRSVFDEVLPRARTGSVRDGDDVALHHFEELPHISLTIGELGDPLTSYWPQFVRSGTSLGDSVGRSDIEQKISEVSSVLAQYKLEVLDTLRPIPVAPNAAQTSASVGGRVENRKSKKGARTTKSSGNTSVDLASITGFATCDNEYEGNEGDALDAARLATLSAPPQSVNRGGRGTETFLQGKMRPLRPSTAPAQREEEPEILEAEEAKSTNGSTVDAKGSATEQRRELSREDFFDAYDYEHHEVFLKYYRFRRLELFLADLLVRQASYLVSTASAQSSSRSTTGASSTRTPSRTGARVWKRSLSPIQHRSNSSSGVAATAPSKRASSAFPQESPLEQVLELLAVVDELTADPIILPSALCGRVDTDSANAPSTGKQADYLFQSFVPSADKSVHPLSEKGSSAGGGGTAGTGRDTLISARVSSRAQTENDLPPLPPNPKDHIAKQILDSKLEVHAGYFLNYLRRTTRIEMLKVLTLTRRRKAQLEFEEASGPVVVRGRLRSATNASPGRSYNSSSALSTSSGLAAHDTSVSVKLALQSAKLAVEIAERIDCPHLLPELLLNKGTIESSLKLFPDSLESGIAAHVVVADVMANIQKALEVSKNEGTVAIEEDDGINDKSLNDSANCDNINNSVAADSSSSSSQNSEVSSYSSTIKLSLAKKAKLLVARQSRAVTNLCTTSPQSLQNYIAWQEYRRLSLEIAKVEEKLQRYSSITEKTAAKLRRRHPEESNDSSVLDESAIRPSLHDLRRVSVATASPTEPPLGKEMEEEQYESFSEDSADGDGGVTSIANPFDSNLLQKNSFQNLGQQGNSSSSSGAVVAASRERNNNSNNSGSVAFDAKRQKKYHSAAAVVTVVPSPAKGPSSLVSSAASDTIPLSFVVELDEAEERHITPLRYLLWASALTVTERGASSIANPKKKVQPKGQESVSKSRIHFPALELLLEEESKSSKSCKIAGTENIPEVQVHHTKRDEVGKTDVKQSRSSSAGGRKVPELRTTISLKQTLRTWGGVLALVYRHIGVVTRLLGDFEGSLRTLVVADATAEQFLAETDDISMLCKQAMLEAKEEYDAQKHVHHAASIITRERHYSDGKPTFPKSSYYANDGGGTSSSFMTQQKRRIARPEWNQSFVSTIPPSAAMAEQQRLADREVMRNYAKTREEEKARRRRIQHRMRLLMKSAASDGGDDGHSSDGWNDDEGEINGPRGDAFATSIGFSIRPSTAGEYFRRRPLTANSTAGEGGGGVGGGSIDDRAGLSPVANDGTGLEADATISSAYDTARGRFALSSPLSRGTTRKPKRVSPSPLPSESHSGGSTPVARSANNKANNKGTHDVVGSLPHLNIKKMQSQSQQLNSQPGARDTDLLDFFSNGEDQLLTVADIAFLRQVHRLKWDPTMSFSRQNRYGSAANDASPFFRDGGRLRPPSALQK